MLRTCAAIMCAWTLLASPFVAAEGDWPAWRGPNWDGMARGDAPLRWSDTEGVAWKATIPGKGHSSPVVWGDRIFLTTAVPTGSPSADRRGSLTGHRFMVLAYERKTGRLLWERVARTTTPHQPHHQQYGSFASNSSVTDRRHLIAFKSSPVGANGKLYLASENDDVIVVKMGRTFELLATNTLKDQVFIATPAIVDGEIYLRSQNTLFCIR
ncbi:MAG: hypothetical protein GEU82_08225 [Luteitalea sp.]|nr:hypothetical protein [Luteitalea sp.]